MRTHTLGVDCLFSCVGSRQPAVLACENMQNEATVLTCEWTQDEATGRVRQG